MKFVFLCDANYLKGDMVNFVNNFPTNHELVTMTSDELLQTKSIFEGTFAVLAERTTWQKNFSLFRYFGLLPLLEVLPLFPLLLDVPSATIVSLPNLSEMNFKTSCPCPPRNIIEEQLSNKVSYSSLYIFFNCEGDWQIIVADISYLRIVASFWSK